MSASGCLSELHKDVDAALPAALDDAYSNYDHAVIDGAVDQLMAGAVLSHSAWDHFGTVVFRDGAYIEWVYVYGSVVCRHTADTLEELCRDVNAFHGAA